MVDQLKQLAVSNTLNPNSKVPLRNRPISGKKVTFLEPEVIEKTNWEFKHARFAIIFSFMLVLIQIGFMYFLNLEGSAPWILAFILLTFFGITIYFLVQPRKEKEIRQKIIETELKTISPQTNLEISKKPIEMNNQLKIIPAQREVPVYREPRTVYIAKSSKVNKIQRSPKMTYEFVGSKLTKVYHKSSCRLGKSIKPNLRIKGQSIAFFRKLRYKPCKVCMKK